MFDDRSSIRYPIGRDGTESPDPAPIRYQNADHTADIVLIATAIAALMVAITYSGSLTSIA